MSATVADCLAERESLIARLRAAFGFSETEAIDFIDQFGGVDTTVDCVGIPVERAA